MEHPEPVDRKTTGEAFIRKRTKSVLQVSRKLKDENKKEIMRVGFSGFL
jgi:hypothetical protein